MKIALILAAAGSGNRMGASKNKVLLPLAGRPLLTWSLDRFQQDPRVRRIVVTTAAVDQPAIQALLAPYPKARAVQGGPTRLDSVGLALDSLLEEAASASLPPWDKVAVHDGARPLLSQGDWDRLLAAAAQAPAALLVRPLTDTIKQTAGGQVLSTIPRAQLAAALTPQIFDLSVLADAYRLARLCNRQATDDAELVERLGYRPVAVPALDPNPKITYPPDLAIAQALLNLARMDDRPDPRKPKEDAL